MICINPILKSPILAAIIAGGCVMLYFYLLTYSPKLPPAMMYSIAIAYFVYFMMGGRVLCDEPSAPAELPPVSAPAPAPAPGGAKVTAVKCQGSELNNPPGCTPELESETDSMFGADPAKQ